MISKTISTTAVFELGNVSDGHVGKWAIAIDSVSGSQSIVVKGRLRGTSLDYAAIAYIDYADGNTKTAALAADALIRVEASGLDVELDVTVTSGSVVIYATPIIGGG